jgi:hypothetical protein
MRTYLPSNITFVCIGDTPRNTKEKTIMTLGSASSRGRVRDALSGRTKVAIVMGASSGIGLEMVKKLIERGYRVVANSRSDAPQHSRSETGGRRHWYRGNGQTCRAYRNSEFWNCRFAGKQRGRLYSQVSVRRVPHDHWPHTPRGPRDWRLKLNYSSIMGRRDKRPLRRRYSSMGGPTMPDPNGSTTVDSSSSDKPTSLG